MKKSILILSSLIIAFSCSKEKNQFSQEDKPQLKSYSDYEVYEIAETWEEDLSTHLYNIENSSLDDKEINEAIWIIEGGINYMYAHPFFKYEAVRLEKETYTLSVSYDERISGGEIEATFLDVYSTIEGEIGGDYLLGVDVKVNSLTTSSIVLDVEMSYAVGASKIVYGTVVMNAPHHRQATVNYYCGSDASLGLFSNMTGNYCANEALVAYKKSKLAISGAAVNFNTIRYSDHSFFSTGIHISSSELFGSPNSAVSAYSTPSPGTTCLTPQDQVDYMYAMLGDFQSITTYGQTMLSEVVVDRYTDPISSYNIWVYKSIKVSEWKGITVGYQGGFSRTVYVP